MSTAVLPAVSTDAVSMKASMQADGLTISFVGSADMRIKDEIHAFLIEIHKLALHHSVAHVTVDLRELEFMNSACIKAFVNWLAEIQALEPGNQYYIHFVSNSKIHWQRRTLPALSCFAADLVRIQEEA